MSVPAESHEAGTRQAGTPEAGKREAGSRAGRRRERLVLVAVALLAMVVYANSLANGFALDDVPIIQENERVHGLEQLGSALTRSYWPIEPESMGMYRPVTSLTFAVDWEIWDGRPAGFHLTNIVLHGAATALLFLLLLALGTAVASAGLAAAVFAVHPVHVEAVANVVGRGEILATGFYLLAILLYLRGGRGWRTAALTAAAYFLALASKEVAATLPAMLLLLEALRHRGIRPLAGEIQRKWRVYTALALTFLAYMGLRYAMIGALFGSRPISPWYWQEPWTTPLLTAIRVWPEYLRLMLFPAELVSEYGPGVIVPETGVSPLVLLGLLVGLAAAGVARIAWKRAPLASVGIGWFALAVVPVAGILIPLEIILAERTLYLPSVGLSLLVAGLLDLVRVERGAGYRAAVALLAVAVVGGAARSWTRTPVWRESRTVIQDLIDHHPSSYRAQWAMAVTLRDQERYDEMLRHFRVAVAMAPGYALLRSEYAMALLGLGLYDEASTQFDTLRVVDPTHSAPPVLQLLSLIEGGRAAEAVAEGEEMLASYPENHGVRHQLSRALARVGRWEEAEEQRLAAIRRNPGPSHWRAWGHLAALHLLQGDSAAAAAALDSARSSSPDPAAPPSFQTLRGAVEERDTTAIPFW